MLMSGEDWLTAIFGGWQGCLFYLYVDLVLTRGRVAATASRLQQRQRVPFFPGKILLDSVSEEEEDEEDGLVYACLTAL